ncbi:protein phosphatase 1 regulatory subunit 3D [Hemicordylus capensis]|uniref:protein phosphatase 1 regulatory subunit 3D n=1 Tax=Hemicordylus capensis TaxID=884348 RepID=UPI0023029006|nr:protein phosphatase 1 regulatory subunit 3D [Hemicordylus capensis]
MSQWKMSSGAAFSAQAARPQEEMVSRAPRRSPSYLSHLYQNMLRDEEARRAERSQRKPVHSSSSASLLNLSINERMQPRPGITVTSCDPHLRPIMRRRARSLPSSPERRRTVTTPCRVPGCSTRRNRVRFADALGLELAEVKVFQAGEDPSIPLHVLSRLSINSDLCCSRLDLEFTMQCLVPDFQQPIDCEDFFSRLQRQQVCLERVTSSDLGLNGSVKVINVAFEKQVVVRYTFNHWRGQHEVGAQWHSSAPGKDGQGQVDVFTFFLPVPPFLLQLSSVVEFAVCYRVSGQEYWDNNQGKNYGLTCRSHPLKMPRECEESWIHFI